MNDLVAVGPLAQNERIVAIDVLRGFALLGILGANISLFDVPDLGQIEKFYNNWVIGVTGAPFVAFFLVLVLNKMMALFSLLFGAGVLLSTKSVERRGGSAFGFYYRRNFLLLGLGLLHGLLWFGDILAIYGVCAMVLYPLRNMAANKLFGAGGAVWMVAILGFPGSLEEYILRALAMMLCGMGLYRTGVITAQREPAWYRRTMSWSFAVGLPLSITAWLLPGEESQTLVNNLGVPFMALGYVCLVMWFCGAGRLPRLQKRLARVGQMALTNYLMQTVLGVLIIGILNELHGQRVTAFWMMMVMLFIWGIQIFWSNSWLAHFRFGPVEWLWRSATYGKWQKLKK